MKKVHILETKQEEHVFNERRIMLSCECFEEPLFSHSPSIKEILYLLVGWERKMIYFYHVLIMFILHYSFLHNVSVISIYLSTLSHVPRRKVHLSAVGGLLGWRGVDDSAESRKVQRDKRAVHCRMCCGGVRVSAQSWNYLSVNIPKLFSNNSDLNKDPQPKETWSRKTLCSLPTDTWSWSILGSRSKLDTQQKRLRSAEPLVSWFKTE